VVCNDPRISIKTKSMALRKKGLTLVLSKSSADSSE
jgi:hypothetical protein